MVLFPGEPFFNPFLEQNEEQGRASQTFWTRFKAKVFQLNN